MTEKLPKSITKNGWPRRNDLPFLIRAAKRLLRSRVAVRLARAVLPQRVTTKPHDQVAWDFLLTLAEQLYAGRSTPAVWTNIFVPCELIWGMGLVPFYPETAAGIGAGLGLSPVGVEGAAALDYPVDLCTFNRSAVGLGVAGFYPRADAYISTSNVCDVSGQILANFAHANRRPFTLLDVPQSDGKAATAYLTAQLAKLVDRWTTELGVSYEPERMRQAVRLSNQARMLALEVAALREANPAPLRGSSMLGQLGILTMVFGHPAGVTYYKALRDYTLERIRRAEPEQEKQEVRLYWMHLKPYFAADLLPHLEDGLGGVIAFEETSSVWWEPLDEEQPLHSLARKMATVYMNGPVERRVDLARRHIARFQCAAAIHFSHWGCRQSSGALRNIRAELRKEGIPFLVLDGDCVDPTNLQLGPLRTRVDAFFEMLV
jgi:benzoyl-CoA reductase/2-hydroxyglutaryl-CoA dehydratase subunit BcrC/BadD/HgdB